MEGEVIGPMLVNSLAGGHIWKHTWETSQTNATNVINYIQAIFRMEGEVIGPMLVNSTPTCYNSTLLPSTFPNLTELNVLHKEVGQHC